MVTVLLPTIINIITFVLLMITGFYNRYIMYAFLAILFGFAFIAFDLTARQAGFYLVMLVFGLFFTFKQALDVQTSSTQADINSEAPGGILKGFKFHIFTVGLGIFITFVMFMMQGQTPFSILGYPTLSATSLNGALELFAPTLSGALGLIENLAFIGVLYTFIGLLKAFGWVFGALGQSVMVNPIVATILSIPILIFGVFSFALPTLLTGLTFGLFHLNSYGLMIGAMVWAALIMIIWIISWYFTNKDTTAMDVAHYLWNAINTGRATFSIAF